MNQLSIEFGFAEIGNVGQAQQLGFAGQFISHYAPESARSTGNQKSFHENLQSDGIGQNSTVRLVGVRALVNGYLKDGKAASPPRYVAATTIIHVQK